MKCLIRIAQKNDLLQLTQLYEKNALAPIKTVCEKSINTFGDFCLNKDKFIIVCEIGNKIVASCEVSIIPSLSFSSGGHVIVSAMCYENESCYEQLCLLVSKVKEIASSRGCNKVLFFNEMNCGFLNSIYMSSGLRNEHCYAK